MSTKPEIRTLTGVQVRAAAGNEFALVGVAASYNMPSKPIPGGPAGTFTEYVAPSAFKRSLATRPTLRRWSTTTQCKFLGV